MVYFSCFLNLYLLLTEPCFFQFIEEAERSLHDAIMIVRRALKNSNVVAGGGAIDVSKIDIRLGASLILGILWGYHVIEWLELQFLRCGVGSGELVLHFDMYTGCTDGA